MKKSFLIIVVMFSGLLLLGWLAQGCLNPDHRKILSSEDFEKIPAYKSLEEAVKQPDKVYNLNLYN